MGRRKSKTSGTPRRYNAYRVTSPAHETKIVFAAGIWSAVGALLQWRVANGIGEVPFTIDSSWASTLTGVAREHIDAARAWCREPKLGMSYRADLGWGLAGPMDFPDDDLE